MLYDAWVLYSCVAVAGVSDEQPTKELTAETTLNWMSSRRDGVIRGWSDQSVIGYLPVDSQPYLTAIRIVK